MSLPYSSSNPANSEEKVAECFAAGALHLRPLRRAPAAAEAARCRRQVSNRVPRALSPWPPRRSRLSRPLSPSARAGAAIKHLLHTDLKPSTIMTKPAFKNAIVTVMALGGSTNAVLHLIAMGRAVGVELSLEDFQTISDKVPFIADLKPSGK